MLRAVKCFSINKQRKRHKVKKIVIKYLSLVMNNDNVCSLASPPLHYKRDIDLDR